MEEATDPVTDALQGASMHPMLIIGVALTLIGLAVLIWCIIRAFGLRRMALPEPEARAALARLVPINLAALLLSAMGLILVVTGIVLS
ncbi:hypothetical protein [Frigidibacter sp. ROC022]|uniref:hypothetical protein n=1 Tax=Frigidibacter sp. ROC022 TaxID=2971796 RepID=UPI00215AE516|nr:hypothetical protein [Frigidibacter sp. ROC022]MCR8726368.1 hypothetical protein [Frigidibacter sp. ROC022]